MSDKTELQTEASATEGLSSTEGAKLQRLVTLPPYVEAKHRKLVADAERALDDYRAALLKQIEKKLFHRSEYIKPTELEIEAAQKEFLSDPMLQHLMRNLGEIKILVEQHRFMIVTM